MVVSVVMVVVAVFVAGGGAGGPTSYEHKSVGDAANMKSQSVVPAVHLSLASITDLSWNARVTTRLFCPIVNRLGS